MNVAVIGASNKSDRYSYKAVMALKEKGHIVFPVHPRIKEIEGMPVVSSIADLPSGIDIMTMYVSAEVSSKMADQVIDKHPKCVIFNPGAENQDLAAKLHAQGIEVKNACTLVLLKTGQI